MNYLLSQFVQIPFTFLPCKQVAISKTQAWGGGKTQKHMHNYMGLEDSSPQSEAQPPFESSQNKLTLNTKELPDWAPLIFWGPLPPLIFGSLVTPQQQNIHFYILFLSIFCSVNKLLLKQQCCIFALTVFPFKFPFILSIDFSSQ